MLQQPIYRCDQCKQVYCICIEKTTNGLTPAQPKQQLAAAIGSTPNSNGRNMFEGIPTPPAAGVVSGLDQQVSGVETTTTPRRQVIMGREEGTDTNVGATKSAEVSTPSGGDTEQKKRFRLPLLNLSPRTTASPANKNTAKNVSEAHRRNMQSNVMLIQDGKHQRHTLGSPAISTDSDDLDDMLLPPRSKKKTKGGILVGRSGNNGVDSCSNNTTPPPPPPPSFTPTKSAVADTSTMSSSVLSRVTNWDGVRHIPPPMQGGGVASDRHRPSLETILPTDGSGGLVLNTSARAAARRHGKGPTTGTAAQASPLKKSGHQHAAGASPSSKGQKLAGGVIFMSDSTTTASNKKPREQIVHKNSGRAARVSFISGSPSLSGSQQNPPDGNGVVNSTSPLRPVHPHDTTFSAQPVTMPKPPSTKRDGKRSHNTGFGSSRPRYL